MESAIRFGTYVAWVSAVLSTSLLIARIISGIRYEGSLEQKFDAARGMRGTFPLKWPGIIAIVSWSFIAATW